MCFYRETEKSVTGDHIEKVSNAEATVGQSSPASFTCWVSYKVTLLDDLVSVLYGVNELG